ncbi:MAG: hypothetical protein O2877_01285 [bacterium]|nr:hypothetical protein [bacterium]
MRAVHITTTASNEGQRQKRPRPRTVADFNTPSNPTSLADTVTNAKFNADSAVKEYFHGIIASGKNPTLETHLTEARSIYIKTLKRSEVVGVPDTDEMRLLAEHEMRRRYCANAKKAAEEAASTVFEAAKNHDEGRALRAKARNAAVNAAADLFRGCRCPGPEAGAEDVVRGISFDTLAQRAGKLIPGDTIHPVSSMTRSGEGPRASA